MIGFQTKQEIDCWYAAAMNGLSRALSIYGTKTSDPTGIPTDYLAKITLTAKNLTDLRDDLYLTLEILEQPPIITLSDGM